MGEKIALGLRRCQLVAQCFQIGLDTDPLQHEQIANHCNLVGQSRMSQGNAAFSESRACGNACDFLNQRFLVRPERYNLPNAGGDPSGQPANDVGDFESYDWSSHATASQER